jgi:hypothetical protein
LYRFFSIEGFPNAYDERVHSHKTNVVTFE